MSNFFLINETLNLPTFDSFKNGMDELTAIERIQNHTFWKHQSIYDHKYYIELFNNYGPIEQEIIKFIEQLSPSQDYVNTEEKVQIQHPEQKHGFLGICFAGIVIHNDKQVIDDPSYKKWIYNNQTNFEKLGEVLGSCVLKASFEKEFKGLKLDVQESIVNDFQKAKDRNLKSPFYPDTKIIADVSPDKAECNVYELRVYTPVALRVYFHEANGVVYIASVEHKSNSDQTNDIKKAHKALKEMIKNV